MIIDDGDEIDDGYRKINKKKNIEILIGNVDFC